ncbi:hypothetical protein B0H17DRAFT_1201226 [Mycena rosella]|uniref:Uncharacterized protein n=1 Tax=Mycena rosella TaxID=1033263 RepID=A0AAD7DIN0_MYCRO|nr:hypothetical protein B0H17DRAFT_1201226 [Mycena rosella]
MPSKLKITKRGLYTTLICVAIAIAVGVIVVLLVAPAVLGFGAAGPVAGILATSIQAGIGNVAASSLFAGAQSVAMSGALPALGYVIAGVVSGAAGASGAIASRHSVFQRQRV